MEMEEGEEGEEGFVAAGAPLGVEDIVVVGEEDIVAGEGEGEEEGTGEEETGEEEEVALTAIGEST